jgi:D-hexose-6-phosphate mutarotase
MQRQEIALLAAAGEGIGSGITPHIAAVAPKLAELDRSVVWNPWAEKAAAMVDLGDHAWRRMVCVEAGNIADNEVRLAADAEHVMSTAVSVDARS